MGLKWKNKKYVHDQTGMKVNICANDTWSDQRSIPQPAFDGEEYNKACDLCCLLSHLIPISPVTGCHIKSKQKSLRLLWKERQYKQFFFFFLTEAGGKSETRNWIPTWRGGDQYVWVTFRPRCLRFMISTVITCQWYTDYHFYFLPQIGGIPAADSSLTHGWETKGEHLHKSFSTDVSSSCPHKLNFSRFISPVLQGFCLITFLTAPKKDGLPPVHTESSCVEGRF